MVRASLPLVLAWLAAAPSAAIDPARGDALPLEPAEVKARWHGRLDGRHFVARVRMQMNLAGLAEERRLTVVREDEGRAAERVLIRFEAPPDLRHVGLLYAEHEGRPNDYFLYQPATRRVRRLPASVADDDVYGIDLEFLGFGVAQTEPTELESMDAVELEGRAAYRLHERARETNPRFERRITWIDAESFVPLRTEHIRGNRTALVAQTRGLRTVQGVPTPVEIHFSKAAERHEVVLLVDGVDYESPIPDEQFSVLSLLKAEIGAARNR